jgi:hypothetical protein
VVAIASVPGLKGWWRRPSPGSTSDLDQKRVDYWLQEFSGLSGTATCRSYRSTSATIGMGTTPGDADARAIATTTSRWPSSADRQQRLPEGLRDLRRQDDAQSGPTTWTARSVALVASPFARRGSWTTLYSTRSALDGADSRAAADDIYDAAATRSSTCSEHGPQRHCRLIPNVALDEKNPAAAIGASASSAMNWATRPDAREPLNDHRHSVKGPDVPMPPPPPQRVRRP